jgi:hypothetical protein
MLLGPSNNAKNIKFKEKSVGNLINCLYSIARFLKETLRKNALKPKKVELKKLE